MIIKREVDYAVRLLQCLDSGRKHSALELSEGTGVPKLFAYRVLKKLHRAGLVTVYRGPEGGYVLAGDLEEVTLLDIMKIMEYEPQIHHCMKPEHICPWKNNPSGRICCFHRYFHSMQEKLHRELERYSLREILAGNAVDYEYDIVRCERP